MDAITLPGRSGAVIKVHPLTPRRLQEGQALSVTIIHTAIIPFWDRTGKLFEHTTRTEMIATAIISPGRMTRQLLLMPEESPGTAATAVRPVGSFWSTILQQDRKRHCNEKFHVGYDGGGHDSWMECIDGSIKPSESDRGARGCFPEVDTCCGTRI